jgi:CRP/FNR family transcriptional regulator
MKRFQFDQLPSELQALVAVKDLAAGQILFAQREVVEAVFMLESGQIQLVNYTEDGQKIHHYTVRADESFAEVALFHGHYLCTAIANVPSRVLVLPKPHFLNALKSNLELAETFMAQLAHRLHETKILLELRSIRSAQNRVLHYLQLNVQADGVTVDLNRPLKEIAEDLGLSPEALSRALKQLETQKAIHRNNRKITLSLSKLDSNQGNENGVIIDCKTS